MPVQLNFTPQTAFSQGVYAGGAKVNFFLSGTDTAVTVYTTETLSTPHPKPIVADAFGVFPQVFTDGAADIKAVITTAADTAVVTIDPVALTSQSGSGAVDISFSPVTGNSATNVQAAIAANATALSGLGSAAAQGFFNGDIDFLTSNPGLITDRQRTAEYVTQAIASSVSAPVAFSPTVSAYSPGTISGTQTLTGSHTDRGDRWDAIISFNLNTSDNVSVGDLIEISSLPALLSVSSSFSYHHVGTFSLYDTNPVVRTPPANIASGVVTMARGSGGRRLYLTVTDVKGAPTWGLDGEAIFRYYG